MEDQLFSPQLFTPGSDIAIGFRPSQLILGRVGNDVVLGYQPDAPNPDQPQVDILLGDFPLEDPAGREFSDTFILGDWTKPYYANGDPSNSGLNDFALITDFNSGLDSIQLYGSASDYQLLDVGFGTAIAYQNETGPDVVGFLLGASGLDLGQSYFQFRGTTPPPGPVVPETKQFGTSAFDIPLGIVTDPSGNVYVGGGTNGSLAGANEGLRDNFVTKYNGNGTELFTQQFGTAGFETIYGIDTDNQGNYYITGVTDGELAGPRQANLLDTFVAKYDSNGNQQWIQQIGQNEIFNAFNIAVDKNTGDVFISGADVKSSIENPDDSFVIKFDTNGNQQWFTEIGTSGFLNFDENYGLTVGNDGSVYVTGWTNGDLAAPNQGVYDNWLAKLDNSTGAQQWVTQYGTADYEWSWDVRTDSQGNVYTTGWTLGDLAGTGNAGSYDSYLTKFDSEGNQLWVKQFGTAGDDEAYSLFIDQNDNLFVSGYTDGNLGGTNAGSFDAWVASFDTSGNQQWITQFGTPDRDESYGVTADNFGNLFVTGVTQGSLGASNAGSFDGWVAKLDATTGTLLNFNGSDTPPGGGGDTTDPGDNGGSIYNGGDGDDVITASAGDDVIYAGEGNNTINAGNGNDEIYAGAGNDIIDAGAGDDLIYADHGDNIIYGGTGNNTVYTGSGNDLFALAAGEGSTTIMNFNACNDLLGLTQGLTFEQLSITQGMNGEDIFTQISIAGSNDILATLTWVPADTIDSSSFTLV
ncbi:MAG TPA: SBBP repeat-containing protein [Coleofasciculaceae cyanobacterium]